VEVRNWFQAHVYAEGIKRGGTLVTVRTDRPADAEHLLDQFATVDIADRRSSYARTGWRSFESID
jgi:hypothetical protein